MSADGIVEMRAMRRAEALGQILRLRRQVVDEAEFGRMAAPIIDALIADDAATTPHRTGLWSDEEREILRTAFATFDGYRAVYEAAKSLSRTRTQIRSMAGNMGLKR
jgi:hypothetical protein